MAENGAHNEENPNTEDVVMTSIEGDNNDENNQPAAAAPDENDEEHHLRLSDSPLDQDDAGLCQTAWHGETAVQGKWRRLNGYGGRVCLCDDCYLHSFNDAPAALLLWSRCECADDTYHRVPHDRAGPPRDMRDVGMHRDCYICQFCWGEDSPCLFQLA